MKVAAGGTCGNIIAILSYLGWQAYPIARLNGDMAAGLVRKDLQRWNVHLDYVSCAPTSDAPVIVQHIKKDVRGQGKHRFSLRCPKCGAWYPSYRAIRTEMAEEISPQIDRPSVFFLDRVSRGAVSLAQECASKGALIVFEPSRVNDDKLFREIVQLAHVLKYSQERIPRPEELPSSIRPLLEVQTLGASGLRFRRRTASGLKSAWKELRAYSVPQIKDAAGAGDWCTATFIHRLAKSGLSGLEDASGPDIEQSLRYGQAAAAWNCLFEGARGGMEQLKPRAFLSAIRRIVHGTVPKPKSPRLQNTSNDAVGTFCQLCSQ